MKHLLKLSGRELFSPHDLSASKSFCNKRVSSTHEIGRSQYKLAIPVANRPDNNRFILKALIETGNIPMSKSRI